MSEDKIRKVLEDIDSFNSISEAKGHLIECKECMEAI